MPIFAKSSTQAKRAMALIKNDVKSVGTNRNYCQSLKLFCDYLKECSGSKKADLLGATKEQAQAYLEKRAHEVSQKTLDMDRQAIQKLLTKTGAMSDGEKFLGDDGKIIKSSIETKLTSRAYTEEQIHAICERQQAHNALATEIAWKAGLRAHELLTIERKDDSKHIATYRPNKESEAKFGHLRFSGREGDLYIVVGKGGHIREVILPKDLAQRLEETKLETPRIVKDREVYYTQKYDISGGDKWSKSFSDASYKVLGWSNGAHGLRHSYAQDRMEELKTQGFSPSEAKSITSLEMGHYREEITNTYLR